LQDEQVVPLISGRPMLAGIRSGGIGLLYFWLSYRDEKAVFPGMKPKIRPAGRAVREKS
jgi:hypothetical protein